MTDKPQYPPGQKPTDRRITPDYILDAVRHYLGGPIALDPCTEGDNPTRALVYWTAIDDGIRQGWRATLNGFDRKGLPWQPGVWVNPPFSDRKPWDDRAIEVSKHYSVFVLGNCEASANYDRLNQAAVARCDLYKRLKCTDPATGRRMDVGRLSAVWLLAPRNTWYSNNIGDCPREHSFSDFEYHFGSLGLCYDMAQVRRDNT